MKKILITGLTGKSGNSFLNILSENKEKINAEYEIFTIVRSTSDTNNIDNSGLNIVKLIGDLDDENFLSEIMTEVEIVFHIAGILKSILLTKAAINSGVKRLIYVHTTGIYSKYKSASEEYLKIEKEIELMTTSNSVALTILRPTMIYGNISDGNISVFIKMIDKLAIMPVVNHGRYGLQPVNYEDLGVAYYQVLEHLEVTKNKNYILSGGNEILLIDIFKEIQKNLKVKRYYLNIPFFIAYAAAVILYYLTIKKIDMRERVQRLCEPRVFDHNEATKDFGYNPRCFEVGITKEIREYIDSR